MKKAKICAVIVNEDIKSAKAVEPLVDLWEVRIDLIGKGWRSVPGQLEKPWLACNRRAAEGGGWKGSESERLGELLSALELKPAIVDIELATTDLKKEIPVIKKKAQCLISFHDFEKTPPLDELKTIVKKQLEAGADICKVVTKAQKFEDNFTVFELFAAFPQVRLVTFAMEAPGAISRILCPLAGGEYTYASVAAGKESASGQLTVERLRRLYEVLKR